ncbi:MAG: hypothetical protein J6Y02_20900 [Pseudobutyrivibrio sp.]|nr:hypothetical protein [Pseudobutyrivibrio sp.]
MLSYSEFMDKKTLILNKSIETYVFNKDKNLDRWYVYTINKMDCDFSCHIFDNEEAHAFYCDRMSSFGYKQFPVMYE